MAKALRHPATYDDLLKVPDHLVAELIDGELFTNPRPASRHGLAQTGLISAIHHAFGRGHDGPGGWWIITEPEVHLGPDVLVPDIGGWRKERMPEFPDVPAFELAPDWVCEVISPSTGRLDRIRKMPLYAEHGIHYAWLVDPVQRTLEVFRLFETHWLMIATHEGDETVRAEPFDAIELNLGYLWVD
jgi:Uma2 family endonuclease